VGEADFDIKFMTAHRRFSFMQIEIDRLVRSKRRTIALIVERDGTFTVRAPLRVPRAEIDSFIQQKADWITRTREKIKSAQPPLKKQYTDGEKFLFLGCLFDLKLVETQKPALKFNDGFTLSQPAREKGEAYFVRWYKEQAFEVISERVREYSLKHDFTPSQVKISSAQTRWGSCSSTGTLNFAWRLVMAPLAVIDYVVVHELAHLRVKNHSRKFWKVVATICPDYKEHRKWLRENGEMLSL
jgi:predicted metal-dependent hydrolase